MSIDITTVTFKAGELKAEAPANDTDTANKKYVDDKFGDVSGALVYKGTLDASGPASQLNDAQVGWFWLVNVAGTLLGKALNIGDEVFCKTAVIGTPTDFSSFEDVPTSDGILRTNDVINNLTSNVIDKPLSANQGRILHEKSLFMIWAEEVGPLSAYTNSGFQWSFGNGQETGITNGVLIPFNCELISVTLSCDSNLSSGSALVSTYRSGSDVGGDADITVNPVNSYKAVKNISSPIVFLSGDYLNFRTLSADGTVARGIISCTFRTT